jgi:uncharacterized membrane protein
MNDQQIAAFVKNSRLIGKSAEEIYSHLLEQGIMVHRIQAAFFASINEQKEQDRNSIQQHTIKMILLIAVFLVGIGLLSLVASNWQGMSRTLQITILLVTMLGSYSKGWYLMSKTKFLRTGEFLVLLGLVVYGLAIFLIPPMFDVVVDSLIGMILWMLGALLIAFLTGINMIFILCMLIGIIILFFGLPIVINSQSNDLQLLASLLIATTALFGSSLYLRRKIPRVESNNSIDLNEVSKWKQ